ncbi:MAG: hypothetical protein ACE5EX_12130, partial [Phycisphaerae bacterium]
PWKTWSLAGRRDLVEYLRTRGCRDDFDVIQRYSMDENLWHLSVEGGDLEDPETDVDVTEILASVADRFGRQGVRGTGSPEKDDGDAADTSETAVSRGAVEVSFRRGVPVGLAGRPVSLGTLIGALNHRYRHAPWAWDLVIENRFTGIKSRGIYINPAARLLHQAIDGLARTCLNKPTYDRYVELGREYGTLLYRGEYFSQQRLILEAAADAVLTRLSGSVTMRLDPTPYVARIASASATFDRALASFEGGGYRHAHAEGFIALSWLSSIGRRFEENRNGDLVEAGDAPASDVCPAESMSRRGLVPTPV